MVKAVVLYGEAPDPQRYAEHVELCLKVPGATFRHGRVIGAAVGDPPHAYYAEFEWPDADAFKAATSSAEFAEAGEDAMAMGKPFTVEFVELN
ncbi:MAG TPA: hypothetical protein VGO39_11570 [Gaiellaceae bacterium]|jgi:hypothetical protein|nr:hypothetical protein [Gaiellaceae bacterium]